MQRGNALSLLCYSKSVRALCVGSLGSGPQPLMNGVDRLAASAAVRTVCRPHHAPQSTLCRGSACSSTC